MPKRKTQEEFECEVNNILGGDYVVLGEYINNHTKIEMHHTKCKQTFLKLPKEALNGSGCPFCCGSKPALYSEQWVRENAPLPYHYVGGYTRMARKCSFYCDICKEVFLQVPTKLIHFHIYGCKCAPTKKKTHQEFLDMLGEECLNEYDIIDNYVNFDTKLQIKHKKCGTIFKVSPDKFILRYQKVYCPSCYYKKSKGEVCISNFLTTNNIIYEKNFSFPDLKFKMFDFYLPQYSVCIEYDGEQHFRPIQHFGGQEGFKDCKRRDQEKNEYCIRNNIPLFRIPYWDKNNISQILQDILIDKNAEVVQKYSVFTT